MKILITAANGRTGRHVLAALQRLPERPAIRAFARQRPEDADDQLEFVIGDMDNSKDRAAAVAGVDTVVHYGPALDPREIAIGTGMIDAAVAAGVKRFIFISVIHPQIEDLVHHHSKQVIEAYLINAGITWTIIRPQHYVQNIDIKRVAAEGVLTQPTTVDTVLGHVDMADVAEVVAKVIMEQGHDFATYDLAAGDHLSNAEMCEIVARITGRQIGYRQITVDEIIKRRGPDKRPTSYTIEGYHRVFSYYSRRGLWANPNVLTWLLGRPPATFEDYVKRSLGLDAGGD